MRARAGRVVCATSSSRSSRSQNLEHKWEIHMPTFVSIAGSQRTLLPNSRPAGPIDPSAIASVTVRVEQLALAGSDVQTLMPADRSAPGCWSNEVSYYHLA